MKIFHFKWPWKAKQNENERYLEWERLYNSQLDAMKRGEEIVPPWAMYPDCNLMDLGPLWGGWRQGVSEAWLHDVWFPFWKKLTLEEREEYVKKWPPPTEDWGLYLREYWK